MIQFLHGTETRISISLNNCGSKRLMWKGGKEGKIPTRRAPRFSSSWSVLETPRRTELTPSLRRHQAGRNRENTHQTSRLN